MAERNLSVDHTTVWRWVQRYAPELNRQIRRELKRTGTSWRVDETYVRVAGRWMYLYRAVDSGGATLDFYLSENRDAAAAKQFFGKVLAATKRPRPCVINSHFEIARAAISGSKHLLSPYSVHSPIPEPSDQIGESQPVSVNVRR